MYRHEHSALLQLCQSVIPHVKPPLQPPNHFHLLLQISGMHCQIICPHLSSIPTLAGFRRALKHHLFLLAYPDSSAKSGKIKPAQCISLRDTVPTTATAPPGITMPPIWRVPSERLQLVKWFISHRLHTGACVNLVLLTYYTHFNYNRRRADGTPLDGRHGISGLCDGSSWRCITKCDTLSWTSWFNLTRFCITVGVSKQE